MDELRTALVDLLNQLDRQGVGQYWPEYIEARRVVDESLEITEGK